jgi:hypothetical protein
MPTVKKTITMKLKLLVGGCMLAFMPFLGTAQEMTKTKTHNGKMKSKTIPTWGPAHQYTGEKYVYFPDYYTFYEPDRGYVYWNNGKWTTSTTVPSYMSKADMNAARMQVIEETTVRPETQYRTYIQQYPAQKVEVTVPVPDMR